MSLQGMLQIHDITVLRLTVTQGQAMAARRTYSAVGTVKGRLMPKGATRTQEAQKPGYVLSATVYFPRDHKLKLSDRLQINGTIYRIVPPYRPHLTMPFWKLNAEAHAADNEGLDELG